MHDLYSNDAYYSMSCLDGGQSVGAFPYVDKLRVDSSNGDAFKVTTYTNQSFDHYFPHCTLSSTDGCEVSSDVQCGFGIKSDLVVALKCKNPSADCNLRVIIDLNCTVLSSNSSSSSGGSGNREEIVVTDSSTSGASNNDHSIWKIAVLSCTSVLAAVALSM